MKKLLEISDKELGLNEVAERPADSKIRTAARAVLLDNEGMIALQFVSKDGYHKLPGGGVENGESIEDGLRREIREEVGCELEIINNIGETLEHRYKYGVIQTSFCYLAKVVGKKGLPQFEQDEIEDGMISLWTDIDTAINLIKKENPEVYQGKFIVKRDLAILEEAKKII